MGFYERAFYRYGCFVARHPRPFFVVPVAFTLFSVFGVLNFSQVSGVWELYTSDDAPTKFEKASMQPFTLISGDGYYEVQILVEKKHSAPNRSLLDWNAMDQIYQFNEYIEQNLTFEHPDENSPLKEKTYDYSSVCGEYCSRESVHAQNGVLLRVLRKWLRNPTDSNLVFTYPTARVVRNEDVFLGYSIGGLTFNDREHVTDFELFFLYYHVYRPFADVGRICIQLETAIEQELERFNADSPDLQLAMYSEISDLRAQNDVPREVIVMLPLTALGLFVFATVSLIRLPLHQSQHIEGIMGTVGPSLAIVTTFGGLIGLGYPYSNVLCVVPFLTLVIGLDDCFLLLTGWRETRPSDSVEHRIGHCLSQAGTSVTITSLTDVLCFVAGRFSTMPVVRLFSLFTAVALTVDYVYQLTYFVAFMTIMGEKQQAALYNTGGDRAKNAVDMSRSHPGLGCASATKNTILRRLGMHRVHVTRSETNDQKTFALMAAEALNGGGSPKNQHQNSSTTGPSSSHSSSDGGSAASTCSSEDMPQEVHIKSLSVMKPLRAALRSIYSKPRNRLAFTTMVFLVYLVNFILSIYLTASSRGAFSLARLYLTNSRMYNTTAQFERHMLNDAYVVNFVCRAYPDFTNETTKLDFLGMIKELESIAKYGTGAAGTRVWVRDYEKDIGAFFGHRAAFWEQEEVLKGPFKKSWLQTDDSGNITSFWFTLTYRNISNTHRNTELLLERRRILSSYPQFDVTSWSYLDVIVDIEMDCPNKLMQTTGTAVILMAILVLIFVRNAAASFWVINSLFMIGVAVIGFTDLWDVSMDGVSMLSILLAVGCAVDYTAHVCYHFYTHPKLATLLSSEVYWLPDHVRNELKVNILLDVYRAAGWPILQGSLGNCLGMIPLVFFKAYIVEVFWKTVYLVAFFAWFSALLFLPTAFITFTRAAPARPNRHHRLLMAAGSSSSGFEPVDRRPIKADAANHSTMNYETFSLE